MGDYVVVASCAGTISAVGANNGKRIWKYDVDSKGVGHAKFHGDPLVVGDLVILGSDDTDENGTAYVYALDVGTGSLRWRSPVGHGVMTDLVTQGTRVYAVTLQDELICLDVASGRPIWRFASGWSGAGVRIRTTPALGDKAVFFGGQNGVLYSLDARDGVLLWTRDLGSPVRMAVTAAQESLYVGTEDARLYRINPASGVVVSHMQVSNVPVGPVLATPTALILLVSMGRPGGRSIQALEAVDLALERVLWTSDNASDGWTCSRPRLWNGKALVGDAHGNVTAVSANEGTETRVGTLQGVVRGIGVAPGRLLIGTLAGKLYAYRLRGE